MERNTHPSAKIPSFLSERDYSKREGEASYGRLAGTLRIGAVVGHHNPPENGTS